MKGYDIYRKTVIRLGYGHMAKTGGDKVLLERMQELINQTAIDLKLDTIRSLASETGYTAEEADAVVSGVAMLFTIGEGDGERGRLFTEIYNLRRGMILGKTEQVEDVMPSIGNGEY